MAGAGSLASSEDRSMEEELAPLNPSKDLEDCDDWVKVGPIVSTDVARQPTVPRVCGRRVCDPEVLRMANALARKAVTAKEKSSAMSMSWCVGPCIRRLFSLLLVGFAVPPIFLAIGYFSAHCDHGILEYNYSCAFMGLGPLLVLNLFEEYNCIRHVSIPFAQQVGARWTVMGLEWFGERGAFTIWRCRSFLMSLGDLIGGVTPSLFTGVILARNFRDPCGTKEDIDKIWRTMMHESSMLHSLSNIGWCALAICLWLLQFAPLLYCASKTWPGWNQWKAGSSDFNKEGALHEQDLELEVVEYVAKPKGHGKGHRGTPVIEGAAAAVESGKGRGKGGNHSGVSVLGKSRPQGNRFFYFTVFREFILTGAAFGILGDAVGFSSMALIQRRHAQAAAVSSMNGLLAMSDECKQPDLKKGVLTGKKFMQHNLSVAPTIKQRVLFKAILGDGVQLQFQITIFAIFKLLHPSRMSSLQLWISIIAAFGNFFSAMLVIIEFFKFRQRAVAVDEKLTAMSEHCKQSLRRESLSGADKLAEIKDLLQDVKDMRRTSSLKLIEDLVLAFILFSLYGWALLKLVMAHICEHHMWNINWDVMAGCVDLSGID